MPLSGLHPGQTLTGQGLGDLQDRLRSIAQRGEKAQLITFDSHQQGVCRPGRDRPVRHQGKERLFRVPSQVDDTDRRRPPRADRRQLAQLRHPVGVACEIQ